MKMVKSSISMVFAVIYKKLGQTLLICETEPSEL